MRHILEIADLKALARKRVPTMFFDYVDSGSWSEHTYRANEQDFTGISLRQRVATDISNRSLESEMAGQAVRMPVALAPVGLTGLQHANGEILAAQACADQGVPFTLSTMSICSIEDVAQETSAPFWFQLYVMRDRAFNEALIGRALAVNCPVLMVTLDLQVLGHRYKDSRNGLSAPSGLSPGRLWQLVKRPRWCVGMLAAKRRTFGNLVGHIEGVRDVSSLSAWVAEQFDPTLCWEDIEWIRKLWPGKLVLKGIMDAEDAKMAVDAGADAIIVSNHGGRQLDGAPSSISALPAIVEAVGDSVEIHMDGGIRCGQDVLKALCLGAKGVYIGRAAAYGLGAGGKAGVASALNIIRDELDLTMAMCGERDIRRVGRHNIVSTDFVPGGTG